MGFLIGKTTVHRIGEEGSGTKLRNSKGEFQAFRKIRDECLASGTLWIDPEFPLSDRVIKKEPDNLFWRRPKEIQDLFYKDGKKVVFSAQQEGHASKFSRFDVKQGALGNCFVVAAFAAVANDEDVMNFIIPKDNSFHDDQYCGAFHFRLFRMGRWLDVIVDDRLAVNAQFKPHSEQPIECGEEREFWSCLLEKARAKLEYNYIQSEDGWTSPLEALTGGCLEVVDVSLVGSHARLQKIWNTGAVGYFPCQSNEKGWVANHMYSVTGFANIKKLNGEDVLLMRARNPWGGGKEHQGWWSDTSEKWNEVSEETKKSLGVEDKLDGEFWMELKYFPKLTGQTKIKMCPYNPLELTNEPTKQAKWNYEKCIRTWSNDHIDGNFGPKSQFRFTLGRQAWTAVSFGTLQELYGYKIRHPTPIICGYRIYKLDAPNAHPNPYPAAFFTKQEPVAKAYHAVGEGFPSKSWKLAAGTYCAVVYIKSVPRDSCKEYVLRLMWAK